MEMKNKVGQFLEYCDNVVYHPEYMAKTKTRYVFNMLILCPIIWVCGCVLAIAGLFFYLSVYGILLAVVAYAEGDYLIVYCVLGFDAVLLTLYIRGKLKENYTKQNIIE